jgi:Tol biopolymer transport system component
VLLRKSEAATHHGHYPKPIGIRFSTRTGSESIWRIDTTGANAKQVTTNSPSYAYLAAGGNWVLYDRATQNKFTLWKASLDGGGSVQLNDEFLVCPALSHDGQWIAAFSSGEGPSKIAVVPASGGPTARVFDMPPKLISGLLRWTPDGHSITYIENRAGVSNLWSLPLDGSPPKQITDFKTGHVMENGWPWPAAR